jgi:hypothetical protein
MIWQRERLAGVPVKNLFIKDNLYSVLINKISKISRIFSDSSSGVDIIKNGWPTNDEPPLKGGQNEALSRTYSEMAHLYRTIVVKEPTWYKMVTTC